MLIAPTDCCDRAIEHDPFRLNAIEELDRLSGAFSGGVALALTR